MSAIIKHEGKFYLAGMVYSQRDGWVGFETSVVEVTPEIIKRWQSYLNLADKIKAEHGVDEIIFLDESPTFYESDCDAEPLDEDGMLPPLWQKEPGRTDSSRMVVQANGYLYWRVYARYADQPTPFETCGIGRADLDQIEKDYAQCVMQKH